MSTGERIENLDGQGTHGEILADYAESQEQLFSGLEEDISAWARCRGQDGQGTVKTDFDIEEEVEALEQGFPGDGLAAEESPQESLGIRAVGIEGEGREEQVMPPDVVLGDDCQRFAAVGIEDIADGRPERTELVQGPPSIEVFPHVMLDDYHEMDDGPSFPIAEEQCFSALQGHQRNLARGEGEGTLTAHGLT